MSAIRPMLGTNAPKDLSTLHYPMYLSPKLDGVRAIVKNGVVYSRSGKPIPNKNVQRMYGHYHGYDGELIYGSPTDANVYNKTVSAVMTEDGPQVDFYAFDYWDGTVKNVVPICAWYIHNFDCWGWSCIPNSSTIDFYCYRFDCFSCYW